MPEASSGKSEAAEVFVSKKMKNTKKIIFRNVYFKTLLITFYGERWVRTLAKIYLTRISCTLCP